MDPSVLAAARAAWPTVELDERAFAEHLARHPEGTRTSDLYLACACAAGDRRAIDAFEAAYFGEIDIAARRTRAGESFAAETKQHLRQTLFVGDGVHPPAIGEFAGRGDLRGWVRIAATRNLIRQLQKEKREVRVDDATLFDAISPTDDPELRIIGDLYKEHMSTAMRIAMEALSARERRLLRMSLLDGLSIDELGVLHGVHRATAARWLQAARTSIVDRARTELARLLGANTGEVDSIVRLVRSRVDLSLERVLATRS